MQWTTIHQQLLTVAKQNNKRRCFTALNQELNLQTFIPPRPLVATVTKISNITCSSIFRIILYLETYVHVDAAYTCIWYNIQNACLQWDMTPYEI